MIKAVIFDMDGVLIDTEFFSDQYYFQILSKMGCTPTVFDFELLRGCGGEKFWNYFVTKYGIIKPSDETREKIRIQFLDFLKSKKAQAVPGAKGLLEKLQKEKILIALGSSASNIRVKKQIKLIRLNHFFKTIVTGEEVESAKPSPEIYLKAAKKLGVEPKECIAIEDAKNGVESAKKAGMKVIGFTGTINHQQDLSKADKIVGSLKEISIDLINSISFVN